MSGVFLTRGLAHLIAGVAVRADGHVLTFDVPLRVWNRRPLVGRASRRSRPSPWAAAET